MIMMKREEKKMTEILFRYDLFLLSNHSKCATLSSLYLPLLLLLLLSTILLQSQPFEFTSFIFYIVIFIHLYLHSHSQYLFHWQKKNSSSCDSRSISLYFSLYFSSNHFFFLEFISFILSDNHFIYRNKKV